jgi:hypothetical protein
MERKSDVLLSEVRYGDLYACKLTGFKMLIVQESTGSTGGQSYNQKVLAKYYNPITGLYDVVKIDAGQLRVIES